MAKKRRIVKQGVHNYIEQLALGPNFIPSSSQVSFKVMHIFDKIIEYVLISMIK